MRLTDERAPHLRERILGHAGPGARRILEGLRWLPSLDRQLAGEDEGRVENPHALALEIPDRVEDAGDEASRIADLAVHERQAALEQAIVGDVVVDFLEVRIRAQR